MSELSRFINDLSSSPYHQSAKYQSSVVERLIGRATATEYKNDKSNSDQSEAVRVTLSAKPTSTSSVSAHYYSPEFLEQVRQISVNRKAEYQDADKTIQSFRDGSISIFSPGNTFQGTYADGEATSAEGIKAMYSSLLGKHSAFEVEGFKGILSAVDRAFAYNPESKESVTFTVTREDQNFDVTNIEPLPPAAEDLPADTPMITAQKGVDVYESDNLWIKTLPSGRVEGEIRTAGKDMRFQGLADAQGNLIAALENGQTYRAHYTMDQEQFKIFSAHLVDA